MSKLMLCSVRFVRGDLGAEEVWQCIGVGGQKSHQIVEQEQQQLPRDRWCAECGRTFSRPGDLKRHKCLLERSRPVEEQRGSVQCTTDGLGMLAALVCTREDSMQQRAETRSFHRKDTCPLMGSVQTSVCVCVCHKHSMVD